MSKKRIIFVFLFVYIVVVIASGMIKRVGLDSGTKASTDVETMETQSGINYVTDGDRNTTAQEQERTEVKETTTDDTISEGSGKGVNLFGVYTTVGDADCLVETENDVMDNVGKVHKRVYRIYGTSGDDFQATFMLNSEYSTLKGTFFLTDDSKSNSCESYMEFYADGEYIGSTSVFSAGVKPEKFELDVTDVEELTVIAHGSGTIAVENLKLYK